MAYLRMRDFWTFRPKEIMENKKWLFECKDNTSDTGSSLLVHVAATHSGTVNQNHRFYRPDRVQDATHQWVPTEGKGYAKPVLFEHDQKGSVLGRVKTARYIDESYKWASDFPTIKDSLFYKTGDNKVDLFKSVDWIVENLMPISDYSGLGYIELGLNVTNPEAIAKVLRDEYLTVSVGFKTGSAFCSVCHTDWALDDKCDHRPGTRDEESKKPVFLICGDFIYEELSFVNFPADPFAGKISRDALKDSLNRKFFMGMSHDKQHAFVAAAGMTMSDAILDYDVQIVEDTVATVYDLNKTDSQTAFEAEIKDAALTAERANELKLALSDWKPEAEDAKTRKRSLTSTLNAKIRKNGWTDTVVAAAITEKTDAEKEIEAALNTDTNKTCACSGAGSDTCECETDWTKFELTTDEKTYFEDEEGLYAEMVVEIDAAITAGELKAEDCKDAKLSTEKRKGLSGSTFCGPNRSFPVPDCAHVTAARRLIGRAKVGDGTKSRILSCVSRKASSLGCGGAKKDSENQSSQNTDTIQVSDKLKAFTDVAEALVWAKELIAANDKDSVLVLVKDLAEKDEAINSLTDEVASLKVVADSATTAKATAGEILKAHKTSLATQIVMYRTLTGHTEFKGLDKLALDAKVEELSKRHVTSLKDAVADIMTELKWAEPKTATPAAKVEEPGKSVADNAQVSDPAALTDNTVVETEAEKLKKQMMADAMFRDKIRFMTPSERVSYMASLKYLEAASKTKK